MGCRCCYPCQDKAFSLPPGIHLSILYFGKRYNSLVPGRFQNPYIISQRWAQAKLFPVLARHGITSPMVSKQNILRLNNWHAWSLEFGVSLNFIAEFVFKYFAKQRKESNGIGLSIPAITGSAMRSRLADLVRKTGGDRQVVRVARQKQIVGVPIFVRCYGETTDSFIKGYQKKSREVQRKLAVAKNRFRRPFRGNPWQ